MVTQEIFLTSLKEAISITAIIFVLMIAIELFVLKYKKRILQFVQKNKFLEYVTASLFGSIPGCIGTFAMDSLYMAGLLSFGGIIATMISTSGDEAFLIISLAVNNKLSWLMIGSLFGVLFLIGIVSGWLANFYQKRTGMAFCEKCGIINHSTTKEQKKSHFLKKHIYEHIIKKHIWQIFLWIFAAVFIIESLQGNIPLEFNQQSLLLILLISSLVGLIPLSGPNVFLIMMFSKGLVPFSIVLANSIIQDGHGLLPIMGFSMKDALKIKAFNFAIGFTIGLVLLLIGL